LNAFLFLYMPHFSLVTYSLSSLARLY
jgi:hypothetical protein